MSIKRRAPYVTHSEWLLSFILNFAGKQLKDGHKFQLDLRLQGNFREKLAITNVKAKVQDKEGIPPEQQRPIAKSKQSWPHLLQREMKTVVENTEPTFRVMQFNILADGLSGIWAPEEESGEKRKLFTQAPTECLVWEVRERMIVGEILRNSPDIVCLQEVDHHEEISTALGPGYEGEFLAKTDSPCFAMNGILDGCSIFWKKSAFSFKKFGPCGAFPNEAKNKDYDQVYLVVELTSKETGEDIVVACTHLKASKKLKGEKIRQFMIQYLLDVLMQEYGEDQPIIFGCDLNGSPDHTYWEKKCVDYPPLVYNTALEHELGIKSAYKEMLGEEPPFTMAQKRSEDLTARTIDFLFYASPRLTPVSFLEIPGQEEIDPGYIPNTYYPSDHFALVADFVLETQCKQRKTFLGTNPGAFP